MLEMREGSRRTWNRTKDHHIVVLHKVAGETPIDEPALTSSGEGAGIEDVSLVSLREAEDSYVKFKVVVVFALEVDSRLLVVVNDDVLVRELQVQLPDHASGEGLLRGMLVVDELDDALDHFVDELCADVGDCCGGNQLRLMRIGDESAGYL
jgi:hypothetical protein